MNFSMELNVIQLGILAAILTSSVILAVPARYNDIQNDELTRLTKLIAKISKLRENKNDYTDLQNSPRDTEKHPKENFGLLLSLSEPIKIVPSNQFNNDNVKPQEGNSVGVEKRQGVWDYDYGLGGGRFGKRGFGDYALGGGRFGRDVDHVDSNESSDYSED